MIASTRMRSLALLGVCPSRCLARLARSALYFLIAFDLGLAPLIEFGEMI
jgi:hypothetical protein